MWERMLIGLASLGIGWAERKLEERERKAQSDRKESDDLHKDTQRPVAPGGSNG